MNPAQLKVSTGQFSDKGRKAANQDFHGCLLPGEPQLTAKGFAIALADGISSSEVSHIASESAVTGFLADYYCTSDAWSVKKSVHRVLAAINSWLYAQTQYSQFRYERDRGYVCTFSAIVFKSTTAHVFHVGDARVYRLHGKTLEQLTNDHRMRLSDDQSCLARAMGLTQQFDIDYHAMPVECDDVFILATDGVYEFISSQTVAQAIDDHRDDLDAAARFVVGKALENGSDDNLTVQIVRIDELPSQDADELYRSLTELPFPPILEARARFDGYSIIRGLHASSRSHVYLARDLDSGNTVVIKTPATDKQKDLAYLERFLMEEWVARRINNPHVLKPCSPTRRRRYLYSVSEYIDGQSLAQWMIDHPKPDLESVRSIVDQVARGLTAFHRLEMLHQDLRPENILIDRAGTVTIIDFGSAQVAGLLEITLPVERLHILGTAQYTAPEYFLGEAGSPCSDLFSLAVIAYQMLSGKLPYGTQVAKTRTQAAQDRLTYSPLFDETREIPLWIDSVLKKALHPRPGKRYQELSEFTFDLRHPSREFLNKTRPPLIERSPVMFWKSTSFLLLMTVLWLLYLRAVQ